MTSDADAQHARYLVPVVGGPGASRHLSAACQLVARTGGHVIALVIGLVPRSLPIGSDVPERWSRLEYEAARVRRFGRERGLEVETILVLSDSAGEAIVRLAEECRADAICLAHEPGLRAAILHWLDPLWRTVLDKSPCPVLLERLRPDERSEPVEMKPARPRVLAAER